MSIAAKTMNFKPIGDMSELDRVQNYYERAMESEGASLDSHIDSMIDGFRECRDVLKYVLDNHSPDDGDYETWFNSIANALSVAESFIPETKKSEGQIISETDDLPF